MSLYYYSDDKGIQGPFSISELAQKGISPLSAVKPEGGSWQNAGDIPALALLFPELQREYFYAREGERRGPFKLEALKREALLPSDLVWYKGLGDWVRADTLPELADLFSYLADEPPPLPQSEEQPIILITQDEIPAWRKKEYERIRTRLYWVYIIGILFILFTTIVIPMISTYKHKFKTPTSTY